MQVDQELPEQIRVAAYPAYVEVEGILKYLEVTHLAARQEVQLVQEHLGLEAVSVEVGAAQPFLEHLCSLPDF